MTQGAAFGHLNGFKALENRKKGTILFLSFLHLILRILYTSCYYGGLMGGAKGGSFWVLYIHRIKKPSTALRVTMEKLPL